MRSKSSLFLQQVMTAVILLLPLLILMPGIDQFAYPPGSNYSDVAITHFPNAIFLRDSLQRDGAVPLWSDTILSGYPFGAHPLSGLWYPPGWLALILPLPLAFNLLILLHLWWGGWGMLRFLRQLDCASLAALAGALTFECLPKLFAHTAAGHVTLIFAVTWTPWLLLALVRELEQGERLPLYSGVVLGLIVLADPRWAACAGLLWAVYGIFCTATRRVRLLRAARYAIIGAGLGAAISAPLWLPLLEFTALSTRSRLTAADNLMLALEPKRLLGLLVPDFWGIAEWMLYVGAAAILLFILALAVRKLRRRSAFWLIAAVVTLLLALGDAVPGAAVVMRLPGMNLLRVPSRFLFLTEFSLAVVTAMAVDTLLEWDTLKALVWPNPGIFIAPIAALAVVLGGGLAWLSKGQAVEFGWAAFVFLLAAAWIVLRLYRLIPGRAFVIGLIPLILLDLGLTDVTQVSFRQPAAVLGENQAAAAWLADQPGQFRIYSPSYSIPQQTAAVHRLELADGVDPMQLTDTVTFMERASGVRMTGYSVTLPPFADDDTAHANQFAQPDAELLGLLNVRYVTSEFDINNAALVPVTRFGETRIYENTRWLPRAWLLKADGTIDVSSVEITAMTANRITLRSTGEGVVVLSEVMYPGWRVQVDSAAARTVPAVRDAPLRAVRVSAGSHEIDWKFSPARVYAGCGIAGNAWLLVLFAVLIAMKRGSHGQPG